MTGVLVNAVPLGTTWGVADWLSEKPDEGQASFVSWRGKVAK
ncbi:hypothetical protein ACFWN2_19400 [Lentzea sp. NPDC058436]